MKNLLAFSLLTITFFLGVACQDKEAMEELEKLKTQIKLEEQNKALINRGIEEMNRGNIDVFNEAFDFDYAFYSPSNSPNPLSLQEVNKFIKILYKAIPDIQWSIQEIIAEGDRVAVRLITTGTHEGEFKGIPATGNKFEISQMLTYLIKDGKIVEEREEADGLGFMMQLGMELKPKGK